jgi:hypothetical protein
MPWHLCVGDSNDPNPPFGGLGYGKLEHPWFNLKTKEPEINLFYINYLT